MPEVFIGLGANIGAVADNLRAAVLRLGTVIDVEEVSSLYRSEPVGVRDQPPFLNAVLRGRTHLDPAPLVALFLRIERDFGRERTGERDPRELDLDLLLYDGRVVDEPGVSVPHPRMSERRFVLGPLAEIAPEAVHPVSGRTAADLLLALASEHWVERLDVEGWPPQPEG